MIPAGPSTPAGASTIEPPITSDAAPAPRDAVARLVGRTGLVELAVSLLIGALFFALLSAIPDLPGGFDAYRHVKQASRLISEPRAMFADPWHLAYFWPKPVDAWFGYHLLLSPFTLLFDLITAVKLFSSLIFGATAYVMFLLLRHLNLSHRIGWVLLTMTGSAVVLTRATTVRPYMLSVFLTLLAALWAAKSQPVKLALISALHALSYSMFFLVVMAPAVWLLVRRDRRSLITALACGVGVCAGVLANPYFPESLRFDIIQASVVQTGLKAHVQLGGELLPVTSPWFLAGAIPVFVLWGIALFFYIRDWKRTKLSPFSNLCLIVSIATLIGTFRVGRTIDFYVPFAILFSAAVLEPHLAKIKKDLIYIAALLALVCGFNVFSAYKYVLATPPLAKYRGAAEYLRTHAPDELVVNAQWADYQFLFFLNSRNRYLIGIEPTFMYVRDPQKYWLWQHIAYDDATTCPSEHCADSERVPIASTVRNELGSQYLLAEHAMNPRVEAALRQDSSVQEVYRDSAFSVFKINP